MKKVFIVLSLSIVCVGCAAKVYTIGEDAFYYEERVYAIDKDGKPITGIVRRYHDSGQLAAEVPYKDGKEDGIRKLYYKSGQLAAEVPYKDGKEEGVEKQYYESGELAFSMTYKGGKAISIVCGNGKEFTSEELVSHFGNEEYKYRYMCNY